MNRKKVLMLVNNDWHIDSRVVREAETLGEAGYEVDVIARYAVSSASLEVRNGVRFHSLPYGRNGAGRVRAMAGKIGAHLRIVRLGLANGGYPPGRFLRDLAWAGAAVVLLGLFFPLVLLLVLLWAAFRPRVRHKVRSLLPARVVAPATTLLRRTLLPLVRVAERSSQARILWDRIEFLEYLDGMALFGVPIGSAMQPDVVHAHDLVTLAAGALIAQRTGARLVYDSHELELHTNYWSLSPTTKKWMSIYEATLIRRVDTVITVCDSIAEWLKEHYPIQRPSVVMNAPDLRSPVAAGSHGVRHAVGVSSTTPLAVYVGSVTIDRGLVECVKATALYPGLHFAFVGPRAAETETEIITTATTLGISDRIHLVDPVPSQQVCDFIASADCSVLAIQNVCLSYYYCFPNKLLESVMAGLPVAVARLIELERFIARFKVGVVMDETSPESIARTIAQLVNDPTSYTPGSDTLATIKSEFGWPTQQQRLRALYDGLTSGVPVRRDT